MLIMRVRKQQKNAGKTGDAFFNTPYFIGYYFFKRNANVGLINRPADLMLLSSYKKAL